MQRVEMVPVNDGAVQFAPIFGVMAAVPEAAESVLMLSGLFAVAWQIRRRKRGTHVRRGRAGDLATPFVALGSQEA